MRQFALLVAALVLGGCVEEFNELQVNRMFKLLVMRCDREQFTVESTLELKNPNKVGVRVSKPQLRLFLGGVLFGEARAGVTQIAGRESIINARIPVDIRYDSLPVDLLQGLEKGSVELTAELSFEALSSLGKLQHKLRTSKEVQLAYLPRRVIPGAFMEGNVMLKRVKRGQAEKGKEQISVELMFNNPFPFPVTVRQSELMLRTGREELGKVVLKAAATLPAKGQRSLVVAMEAPEGSLARALAGHTASEKNVWLTGDVLITPVAGVIAMPLIIKADGSVVVME